MAAYATLQREPSARRHTPSTSRLQLDSVPSGPDARPVQVPAHRTANDEGGLVESVIVQQIVDRIADRLAVAIAEKLVMNDEREDEWFDSRYAAEYLGVHRDTLRKLAAERAVPSEQDGPGCNLYFRRSDLDAWRRSGGRPRYVTSKLAAVA
jgi:excisionase family DNA binding protein